MDISMDWIWTGTDDSVILLGRTMNA